MRSRPGEPVMIVAVAEEVKNLLFAEAPGGLS